VSWGLPYWVPDNRGIWHRGFGKDLDAVCGLPISDEMMEGARALAQGKVCSGCLTKNTEEKFKPGGNDGNQ
jgi:hypothetical protein